MVFLTAPFIQHSAIRTHDKGCSLLGIFQRIVLTLAEYVQFIVAIPAGRILAGSRRGGALWRNVLGFQGNNRGYWLVIRSEQATCRPFKMQNQPQIMLDLPPTHRKKGRKS